MIETNDLSLTIVVVSCLFIFLCIVVTGLRLWVRLRYGKRGLDDYFCVFGLILWLVEIGTVFAQCHYGLGQHNISYTREQELQTMKYFFLFQIFYVWSNIPIKLSICLSILRVAVSAPWLQWTLYFVGFVITCSSFITNVWLLTDCTPVSTYWNPATPGGRCRPSEQTVYMSTAYSIINIVTDWTMALLPVGLLWKVNMPWKQKLSCMAILGLGIFASIATLIRIQYLPKFASTDDYLYWLGLIVLWTIVELGLALIAVSLMALRPLLRRCFSTESNQEDLANPPPNFQQARSGFWRAHGWGLAMGLDTFIKSLTLTNPSRTRSEPAQLSVITPET
ncbi:hypothetical protein BX600DRAFT_542059 [Xylariales sp. PMI_506]|nr:hypothetical protein BX600DRAFT_542059 [Xylariales sp. PMI_506]